MDDTTKAIILKTQTLINKVKTRLHCFDQIVQKKITEDNKYIPKNKQRLELKQRRQEEEKYINQQDTEIKRLTEIDEAIIKRSNELAARKLFINKMLR